MWSKLTDGRKETYLTPKRHDFEHWPFVLNSLSETKVSDLHQ